MRSTYRAFLTFRQTIKSNKLFLKSSDDHERMVPESLRATVQKCRALDGHIKKLKFLHFLFVISI